MGIGDINAGHLAPQPPVLPAPAPAPAPDKEPAAPLAEQQRQKIHEQVDTRPLARLQEEKNAAPAEEKVVTPEQPEAVLHNDDTNLELIQTVCMRVLMQLLMQIHDKWYEAHDAHKEVDVKDIIHRMKGTVLRGCVLAFSGLIPLNERPERCVGRLTQLGHLDGCRRVWSRVPPGACRRCHPHDRRKPRHGKG